MSASARQRMITLHDGARVALRPITPADKPHLAASFERLSDESRYRRFLTSTAKLSGLNSTISLTSIITTTRRSLRWNR
jgi:hypothetical protein